MVTWASEKQKYRDSIFFLCADFNFMAKINAQQTKSGRKNKDQKLLLYL